MLTTRNAQLLGPRLMRRCEMCNDEMGEMTYDAYIESHMHCDLCVTQCEICKEVDMGERKDEMLSL